MRTVTEYKATAAECRSQMVSDPLNWCSHHGPKPVVGQHKLRLQTQDRVCYDIASLRSPAKERRGFLNLGQNDLFSSAQ